jgi:plastocyanin
VNRLLSSHLIPVKLEPDWGFLPGPAEVRAAARGMEGAMRIRVAIAALAAAAPLAAQAGEVRGVVRFEGPVPAPARLEVTKDRAGCGDAVPDERLEVRDGRLANAVLTVKGAPAPRPGKAVLDQRGCRFVPHVLAVAAGSTLEVVNGDRVLHGVRAQRGRKPVFDLAMPAGDRRVQRTLDAAGVVSVRCDVHAWMSAWVVVADAPFAVSGPDGAFTVPDVPAGTWTVHAWHEALGERTARVTVPEGGAAAMEIVFGN